MAEPGGVKEGALGRRNALGMSTRLRINSKTKAILLHALRYIVAVLAVGIAVLLTKQFGVHIEPATTPLFFAAVMVSAWYGGLGPGLLATVLAVWVNDYFFASHAEVPELSGSNFIRSTMFLFAALLISLLNGVRKRLYGELQEALAEVKLLSGLLPICASCKMIRDAKGDWQQIELYISDHSEATFTHGTCPDCFKRQFPDSYEKYKKLYLETNKV